MAVYTQLTNERIAEYLERCYDVGPLDFALGIAQGVENTNYLLVTKPPSGDEEKFILTLYEKRVNSVDLPFFMHLLQHLAGQGVACPKPICRKDGALFGECEGKQASLVSFLHGQSRSVSSPLQVAAVGDALGRLHRATENFELTRANALSLQGWQMLYRNMNGRLDEIKPGLEKMLQQELDYAAQHFPGTGTLPSGIIHADMFPDNVFFESDEVSGIIDFYFACRDMLAYDVAITLNAWCFEPDGEFNPVKSKSLLDAYQKRRPLVPAEQAAFQPLLRGAALRFLLTRAYDWLNRDANALVQPHDPLEYLAKLRFHQEVKDSSAYGI